MAAASSGGSTACLSQLLKRSRTFLLVAILVTCLFQFKISISIEKRLWAAPQSSKAGKKKNEVAPTRPAATTMSACLLVMDDTIKLTEWLAYHYTVLPLSHLIVALDPATVLETEIRKVLQLWKTRLYIELWRNDTWMTLKPDEGWPPGAYDNGTLVKKRIKKVKPMAHVRTALTEEGYAFITPTRLPGYSFLTPCLTQTIQI